MKTFKLIEIQILFRILILNGILCLGFLSHQLQAEDQISLSPYYKNPRKNYSTKDIIDYATKNPKLLEITIDGELPIHHALNTANWDMAEAYARLAPKTLEKNFIFRNFSPYPLDYVLHSRNYKTAAEFIKVNPEITLLFKKEKLSPIRFLNAEKKDIPELKKYPELGTLLHLATRPQAKKNHPSFGGSISSFSYILDQIRLLRETNDFDIKNRLIESYFYLKNLEILTEAYPLSLEAIDWNPKFQLIFLENYLHIVNAFEDLNISFDQNEKYTLDFFGSYNSFLSQLFNNITLFNKESLSFEKPNILHLIHNQLRLSAEYTAEHLGDESTLRWSYVHTILFDLLSKMSKSEAFETASKEFDKKFTENPAEFNKTIEAFSKEYIKKLADYKIDYRSLEK